MSARLIRDRIGDVPWKDEAAKHYIRPVRDRWEHVRLLIRKGMEEFGEGITAESKEDVTEEIGDMMDVLRALASINGIPWSDVEASAAAKRERHGGFENGMVWDTPGAQ